MLEADSVLMQQRGPVRDEATVCVAETPNGAMLDHVVEGSRAWVPATLSPQQWTLDLPDPALAEITLMVEQMRSAPLPRLLRHPDHFQLPVCREFVLYMKRLLREQAGLTVVNGLPVERFSDDELIDIFWILGHLLSKPVATKWDGTMLYRVTDTGQSYGQGVRGSATRVELSFHTDNAFGISLPDYVGLLCIRPALSGGVSRFCSLYTVHNELLRHHPQLLRRLYEPVYYDRQAEHADGAANVLRASMFRYYEGLLSVRLQPALIRRGYEMMGREMDQALVEALECLESILDRPSIWIEFSMKRGQLQYLNNHWCAHFRSSFTDGDDPSSKRHLVRAWYRDRGQPTYDG